jgi:hypothetical protein
MCRPSSRPDELVTCTNCRQCINRHCRAPRAAGLTPWSDRPFELSRALATMPQRCLAHIPRSTAMQSDEIPQQREVTP